jgi:uncharacterized protein (TIGR00369 family)
MLSRAPSESTVTLHQLTLPEHANMFGDVHGGVILKMMDEAGAICAMRHSARVCVTLAVDSMLFHSPVKVGQLVCCRGRVTWVGKTSVEVEVQVTAEDAIQRTVTLTNSGHFLYVALDDARKPTSVPALMLGTEDERRAFAEAEARRKSRLALKRD